MGRAPCCDKANVKRGPWSPEEDATLRNYVENHGTGGNWIALPQKAGLKRCGKSCRLRWLNYLRPDIKHGGFTEEEDNIICTLYSQMGSRWSLIASQLPGRTDNDVKNYWNTKLKKKYLAGKTSFNMSTKTTATAINGFVIPAQKAAALQPPCLPKAEPYNSLDYNSASQSQSHISAPLPVVLSEVGYGFSINTTTQDLPLEPVMHLTQSAGGVALENSSHNNIVMTSSQEGSSSNVSDSTSQLAMESKSSSVSMPGHGYVDDTGNILMDGDDQFNYEFPYEFVNGIWSTTTDQDKVPSCYDHSLADEFSHADIKPQGLN